jgi:hypothetical protein
LTRAFRVVIVAWALKEIIMPTLPTFTPEQWLSLLGSVAAIATALGGC